MNPRAALLFAAWPLAALHVQAMADESGPLQSLPGIDRARVAIPDGSLAGHSVVVFEIGSSHAPREALAEVERHWRAQGVDTVLQAQAGEWFVLSRGNGTPAEEGVPGALDGFETLQLRASSRGGSEGLLTRWKQRSAPADGDSLAGLVPPDAHWVRQLSSGGIGERRGATLVAHFERSLDDAERHLDGHLRRAGFEPLGAGTQRRDLRWHDDRARFYRSASAELLVTLHRQPQGASAVLHHVEVAR